MLYVSTPSAGRTAEEALRPALQALVKLPPNQQAIQAACPTSSWAEQEDSKASALPMSQQEEASRSTQAAAAASPAVHDLDGRPQALLAVWYNQESQGPMQAVLPSNVALCQPPDAAVGFAIPVMQARAALQQVLPGVDMLAGGSQGLAGDDSDEDAIEALDSALNRLTQPDTVQETQPAS